MPGSELRTAPSTRVKPASPIDAPVRFVRTTLNPQSRTQPQNLPAQGALAILGAQSPDGANAARGVGAASRRYGPGPRRALSARVAALEPYIQKR